VSASFLMFSPRRHRLLFEALASLFATDVLRYGLAHDPVCGPLPQAGQLLHAAFEFVINLD